MTYLGLFGSLDWVAVQELKLSYYTGKPYDLLSIPIMVTSFQFLNSNPVELGLRLEGALLRRFASESSSKSGVRSLGCGGLGVVGLRSVTRRQGLSVWMGPS